MTQLDSERHNLERGLVLRALCEDYAREMTGVASLARSLAPVSAESLNLYLTYLSQQGYVAIWRAREMPSFRDDRAWLDPSAIVFAKLMPKGLQLLDGDLDSDPKVAF
jgi:hypothetical protein